MNPRKWAATFAWKARTHSGEKEAKRLMMICVKKSEEEKAGKVI